MLSGLILTAFLMGLGGTFHCAVMCGAACAAALPKGVPLPSLLGRCIGYALLGAVAAASVGTVAQWGRQFAFVQPLWVLVQAVGLLLGAHLAWSGQMPRQVDARGQDLYRHFQTRGLIRCAATGSGTAGLRARGPVWGPALWLVLAGMAWAILPCGLLYAAVMVAALAPSALGGALVMLAFAMPSALGVWGAPALFRRLLQQDVSGHGARAAAIGAIFIPPTWRDPRWAVRLAGLMLMGMGSWALYHQILARWPAWCA